MTGRDWGFEAHQAAVDHLDACDAFLFWEESGEQDGEERPAGDSPAIGPYCGCQTCIVREALHASWPVIEEAVRSGELDSDWDRTVPLPVAPQLELDDANGSTPVRGAS